ncbi:MAG TPA: D-alanyl-D-alanine carboxypeptidase family protein [Stellaceae bacterium]|nr:D-alanyl-D-alanine carboxypeptidase family protein [Stellaceae bacterium]
MISSASRLLFALIAASALLLPGMPARAAAGIDTQARNAIILDFETGALLLDKGADERMPPASMSKIMTAYMVYDALKKGKLSLEDMLPVSEKAWRTQGSKMFVPLGGRVKVEDLVRGMIVQSGNDACIVLAEGIAGSEAAFVEQMNEKAKELGLKNSHFANVTGLPDPNEYVTARDLATLARRLITDFPEYYHYDSEKDFTYNGIKQGNRNPLLYKDLGADGMKTGHTEEAGYCLTGSAIRDGRRIIMVLGGLPSMKARATESERLLEWAFREFNNYRLVKAGDTLDQADVWLGAEPKVPVTAQQDVVVTLPKAARRTMKATVHYDGPVRAPVAKGQAVGKLTITADGVDPVTIPLVAAQPVDKLGPMGRIAVAAGYLVWGKR